MRLVSTEAFYRKFEEALLNRAREHGRKLSHFEISKHIYDSFYEAMQPHLDERRRAKLREAFDDLAFDQAVDVDLLKSRVGTTPVSHLKTVLEIDGRTLNKQIALAQQSKMKKDRRRSEQLLEIKKELESLRRKLEAAEKLGGLAIPLKERDMEVIASRLLEARVYPLLSPDLKHAFEKAAQNVRKESDAIGLVVRFWRGDL